MKRFVFLVGVCLLVISCTKVMVTAVDQRTETVAKSYAKDSITVFDEVQNVLKSMGYSLNEVDAFSYHIVTGWKPTKSDSHYMDLFGRRDYGAGSSGAYYQLIVDVASEGSGSRVAIATTIKTVAGNLKSSHFVENKIFARLDDAFRSSRIDVTNVGVTEK